MSKKQGKIKLDDELLSTSKAKRLETVANYVKSVICDYYGVPKGSCDIHTKKRELVKLRQRAIYLLSENCGASIAKISAHFPYKNESGAFHAKRVVREHLAWDKDLRKEMDELKEIVRAKVKAIYGDYCLTSQFYFIDLNNFTSFSINQEKAIILVGCSDSEKELISNVMGLKNPRNHENTGMYVMEKNKQSNGKRKKTPTKDT